MSYTYDAQGNIVKKGWFSRHKAVAAPVAGLSVPEPVITLREAFFSLREDLGTLLQYQIRLHELQEGINAKLDVLLNQEDEPAPLAQPEAKGGKRK